MYYLYKLPPDTTVNCGNYLLTDKRQSYYVYLYNIVEALDKPLLWWYSDYENPDDRYKLIVAFSDTTELFKTHPELCI